MAGLARKTIINQVLIPPGRRSEFLREVSDPDFSKRIGQALRFLGIPQEEPLGTEHIPGEGEPVVVLANHRFGFKDGLQAAYELLKVRPDVKVVVQSAFKHMGFDNIDDLFLYVDNTKKKTATGEMRKLIDYLKKGGALVIFGDGLVSARNKKTRLIESFSWEPTGFNLARMSEAKVLPLAVGGMLPQLFYAVRDYSMLLSKVLIPKFNIQSEGRRIPLQFLPPILPKDIPTRKEREDLDALAQSIKGKVDSAAQSLDVELELEELGEVVLEDPSLNQKIFLLPPSNKFPNTSTARAYGQARMASFASVNQRAEGKTGIDEFDKTFYQLIVWDEKSKKITGGYRLALGKDLKLNKLYNAQPGMFTFEKEFQRVKDQGIELGRSFINVGSSSDKHFIQKTINNLWKCIHRFIQQQHESGEDIRYLFGGVSLDGKLKNNLKQEIIGFYQHNYPATKLQSVSAGRNEFKGKHNLKNETSRHLMLKAKRDFPALFHLYFGLTDKAGAEAGPAVVNAHRGNCLELAICFDLFHLKEDKDQLYGEGRYSIREHLRNQFTE